MRSVFMFFVGLIGMWGFFPGCKQEKSEEAEKKPALEIKGIYGNPQPLWDQGFRLDSLGVNAIFAHSPSLSNELIDRARKEGARVFAEFATLNGKGYVEEHPEAWAINEKGEKVEAASWFMGVCPSEPGFREYRKQQLRDLLRSRDLDGVWLDYVHWHAQFEEPEPILVETCFCDPCLEGFQSFSGLSLPEGERAEKAAWILLNHDPEWRNWRCAVITSWVRDIGVVLREEKPDALLGLYHCPWEDTAFGGARRRILGLDYDSLRNWVDVFSPMVYHGRMGRDPRWVGENISWLCRRLSIRSGEFPKVWPIVQAYNDPLVISAGEFREVLLQGASACASGLMMFTTYAVAEDPDKSKVLENLYRGRDSLFP